MIIESDSPYKTRHEIEKLLKISRTTIYRWLKEGQFPTPVRFGANMVRWKVTDIEVWMKEREPSQ